MHEFRGVMSERVRFRFDVWTHAEGVRVESFILCTNVPKNLTMSRIETSCID